MTGDEVIAKVASECSQTMLAFSAGRDAIAADQTDRKYTIEDLKQIRDTYRAKCKELGKEQG